MADNYAATDGLYYTPLPKLACDEAAALLAGEKFRAILDIGCGSGRLLSVLAAAHPDASLVGLDISSKMLAHAMEKTAGCPRVSFVEGGAGSLPFSDGSFGAVACIMSFHHYPYPERAVEEAFKSSSSTPRTRRKCCSEGRGSGSKSSACSRRRRSLLRAGSERDFAFDGRKHKCGLCVRRAENECAGAFCGRKKA